MGQGGLLRAECDPTLSALALGRPKPGLQAHPLTAPGPLRRHAGDVGGAWPSWGILGAGIVEIPVIGTCRTARRGFHVSHPEDLCPARCLVAECL